MNRDVKTISKHFSKLGLMYLIGTIVIYVSQYATIGIVKAVAPHLFENSDIALLISMLPMYLIGYPIMIACIKRLPAEQENVEKKKMTVGQWLVAFIMCYALVYISNIIGNVLTFVVGIFKQGQVENTIVNLTMSISPLASFLFMVIAAPIMEEYIFRKLLIDRTVKYGEGLAIVLSGVIFGLFHGNLNQFAYALILGCFYGFIYTRTRNVVHTILLHMLNNFVGSILSMFILEKSGFLELATAMETATMEELTAILMNNISGIAIYAVYVMVLIIIVLAGIVLLILRRKKFYVNHTEEELPKGQRFKTITLNAGMLLFAAFWIVQIVMQLFE